MIYLLLICRLVVIRKFDILKGAISFVATAGAVSNLGFNAYQQDTINDILDDITAKGYQIDSILSKGRHLNWSLNLAMSLNNHI